MAQTVKGSQYFLTTALGPVITITGISNATEGVATTAAAHGLAAGDFVVINSGWGALNGISVRVKAPSANTFVLEGQDTSATDIYVSGAGGGNCQKGNSPVEMQLVTAFDASGGEVKQIGYSYHGSLQDFNLFDGFSPMVYTFTLDADAISLAAPGYSALVKMTQTQLATILRQRLPNGSFVLISGKVAFNEAVITANGQINTVRGVINSNARAVRYAS